MLPKLYRAGLKRLPACMTDFEARHFLADFRKELTQYPDGATWDLVMADWFGEWNIALVLRAAKRSAQVDVRDAKLPPYLLRRRAEVEFSTASSRRTSGVAVKEREPPPHLLRQRGVISREIPTRNPER